MSRHVKKLRGGRAKPVTDRHRRPALPEGFHYNRLGEREADTVTIRVELTVQQLAYLDRRRALFG